MPDFSDATAGWTGSPGPIREPRGNSKSLRTVTADRLVVGSLVALFIAAMEFGACVETRAPSTAECVEDWNERAGSMQRTQVISGGFRLANANGWVAKVIYPGCSVIFVTELDRPWLSCVRTTFRAAVPRLTEWSCEGGQRWVAGVPRQQLPSERYGRLRR
jgi:hypothetical protein